MPIFKDTVALEACPAKTAESVSYAATFAVLCWLLVSNYPGLGYAGVDSRSLSSAEISSTEPRARSASEFLLVEGTELQNTIPGATPLLPELAEETNTLAATPLANLTAWHSNLKLEQQPVSHPAIRKFSSADWSHASQNQAQLIGTFITDLELPLPLVDDEMLFQAVANPELASLEESRSGAIHQITVTGYEAQRLTSRPNNINRPQLPRPYRALEIQRSLLLPPRIQALKP